MTSSEREWLMLTPAGALHAFGQASAAPAGLALQSLLGSDSALQTDVWLSKTGQSSDTLQSALDSHWVQRLQHPMQGPDSHLDNFLQHVVASLSNDRKAALASESGFCLGQSGLEADEAEVLCGAAADYFDFAKRQTRRGWDISQHYVSFHRQAHLLLPEHTFVPLWVDGVGYWLVILGEPLLNNPALVELLWGLKRAGSRFSAAGTDL
jgi:hypothetical protein